MPKKSTKMNIGKVIVILDPIFGDRIVEMASCAHVWAVDSPKNRAAVERHMQEIKSRDIVPQEANLTLTLCHWSKFDPHAVETLEDHHGEYAQTPPWKEVEVIGSRLDHQTKELLMEYGFHRFKKTAQGFLATK